ncbi:MAG: 4-hydroxy-tetrahydrodipicolinate reductase [Lachnospiraceae bacterium]|jgi:4-hydroxy-tetrahydrodipicolinate reductase
MNIIINGCGGHMGSVLADMIRQADDMTCVAGVDVRAPQNCGFPVYPSVKDVKEAADVVIDFSTAAAVDALIDDCVEKKLPLVLCTTGLSDEQISHVSAAGTKIAILRSANMSLGVNVILNLVSQAAKVLGRAGFDTEIVEAHHRRKLDAPSGTALMIADAVNEALGGGYTYNYGRHEQHEPRNPKEIGISSVRGGTIAGVHDCIFCGEDECIEIRHTASSRAIFAKGALSAARFLSGKQSGLYNMQDVISSE